MKRAQAEMVGLLLIVILLAIAFLLYIRFSLQDDGDFTNDFAQTQLGQSYVNSLAKTELRCGGQTYSVEELTKDIAMGTTRCDAEDELEDFINGTLHETHGLWGRNYRLRFFKDPEQQESIGLANFTNSDYPAEERCNVVRRMQSESDHYAIPAYGGLLVPVHIRLEQCR